MTRPCFIAPHARARSRTAVRLDARRRPALVSAGFALTLLLLLPACDRPAPGGKASGPAVVAEVGGRRITTDDLQAEAARRADGRRSLPDKGALLTELVQREQMLARVREAGLDRDPATLREIDNLLIRKLLAADVQTRRDAVTVTDEEVRAEYEANPKDHTRPAQARFAVLFMTAGPKASESRRAEARRLLEEGRRSIPGAGEALPTAGGAPGFGALAIQHSEDQASRYRGGDIGWLSAGEHPPRFPEAVIRAGWGLATGAASGVLEGPEGLYVIMKTDARPETTVSLAAVEATLRQSLLVRKRKAVEDAFRTELAGRFPAQVHEQVLASVTLPATSASLAASNREPQPPVLPGTTESSHGN